MSRALPGLALAVLAACQGVPAAPSIDASARDAAAPRPAARLLWTRSFGAEGEVPAALVAAGPERLFALTDQAIYLLALDGRVVSRTALPAPVRGAGGVSGVSYDGSGLGLAMRWRGDATAEPGTYLGLTDGDGALLEGGLVRLAAPEAPLRSAFDGQDHVALWASAGAAGLELHQTRVPRQGAPSTSMLAGQLPATLALGDALAAPDEVSLCTLEQSGVQLRRFGPAGPAVSTVSTPDRQAIGPCRLASSGRSHLLAWKNLAAPPRQASPDRGLKGLSFDQPVARLVARDGEPSGAEPLRLTALDGTIAIDAVLWDGGRRYLVLLDAAGQRGGRLFLTALDERGQVLFEDVALPIEVEPALLLDASLIVAGSSADYYLLYGLRQPWDEGILYLARFSLSAPARDAR